MRDFLQFVRGRNRKILILLFSAVAVLNLIYVLGFSLVAVVNGPALSYGVGIRRFGSENSKYYVVDEKFVQENEILRKNSRFSEEVPLDRGELVSVISQKLEKEGKDFWKDLYDDVSAKYSDEYKKILKADLDKQMKQDYTYMFFQTMQKSFTLLKELKARYLEQHDEDIKQAIINDYLKDTSDENLKKKLDEKHLLKFDKLLYFKYIIGDILLKQSPKLAKLTPAETGKKLNGNAFHEIISDIYTRKGLTTSRVRLKQPQIEELQNTHDAVVRELRSIPLPPADLYSGDGIAISANGLHLPGALMLAGQLRQVGSELPIEIILDSEKDYNKQACEVVAPKLGATCVVTERILGSSMYEVLGKKPFQLKAVTLLMSSFDNTIALDADNFVTKNPDFLFTSKPYLETKFLLWPDIWHKGTSPLYYDIARFDIGEVADRQGLDNSQLFSEYAAKDPEKEIYFHDLAGTPPGKGVESGQLVFSKVEHFRSLALALYYNLHKEFYYPLLYQGVHGSGDRETFVPALHVMHEPYHICEYQAEFMGLHRQRIVNPQETYFDESTLIQRDPQQTREYFQAWRLWLRGQGLDQRLYIFQENDYTKNLRERFANEVDLQTPDALFLHVHMPKMNPLWNELSEKNRYDYKTRYMRKIGEFNERVGSADYELRVHALSEWVVCKEFTDPEFWKLYEVDQKELCKKVSNYVKLLKEDSNDVGAADLKEFTGLKKVDEESG